MIEYAIKELVRHRRRTIAQIAGYAAAATIITIVVTILMNGQMASGSVLSGTGTHFVGFVSLCSDEACGNILLDNTNEGFYVGSTKVKLLTNSSLELVRTLNTIADAAPSLLFRLANRNNPVKDVTIGGIPSVSTRAVVTNSCSARDIIRGSFLRPEDTDAVVIEESFGRSRYLKLGSTLRLADKDFIIAGIVNTGIRIAKADVYLPMEQARQIINTRLKIPLVDECSMILVESLNTSVHETAETHVKNILGENGSISSYNCYKPASLVMGINNTSALIITITVFACILAFSLQSQYSRVIEKRYEIGILKSMGWPKKNILTQILYESMIQSTTGWCAGSLLAVLLFLLVPSELLVGSQPFVTKQMFPAVFLLNLILAGCGGMIAGLLPGLFAASQKPADCLRRL
jgi:ABC-type antimicrobial peptide transport system permease subunit